MSSLKTGHGLHLLASHRELTKQLEEIERLAVRGKAPGAGGQKLTPLPVEQQQILTDMMSKIGSISEQIARRHSPDSLVQSDKIQPVSATYRWLSLMLRRMEESLEDLNPGRITQKFGSFTDCTENDRIQAELGEILAIFENARILIEEWRTN